MALRARGIRADPVPWTAGTYPWQKVPAVLPRATWDYYREPGRFAGWAASLGARLANPPAMVSWERRQTVPVRPGRCRDPGRCDLVRRAGRAI
jgi:hypothetical protein